jgi:hypothetical protein
MLSLLWLDAPPSPLGVAAFEPWLGLDGVQVRLHAPASAGTLVPAGLHWVATPVNHPRGKMLLDAAMATSTDWAFAPRALAAPAVNGVHSLTTVGPEITCLLTVPGVLPPPAVSELEAVLEAAIAGSELIFRPRALVDLLSGGGLPQRARADLLLVLPSLASGRLAFHPSLLVDPPAPPEEERAARRVQAVLLLVRSLTIPETGSFSAPVRAEIARFLHAAYERELRSWLALRNAQLNVGRTPTWVPAGVAGSGAH